MIQYQNLLRNLRENILAILASSYTTNQLNQLIAVSHSLAHSFLASKLSSRTLANFHGMNTSDLAYDCIADLFQKDNEGNYIQLISYFKSFSLTNMKEEEVLAHLRRLIFSKVNQGIYRLCSEADPQLAKILRNIKIAINTLKNFKEVERFGETCIVPCACDTLEDYPPIDHEFLEQQVFGYIKGYELLPEMLAKLSLYLREQNKYCRIIPLMSVATLFRSIYNSYCEIPNNVVVEDAELVESDTVEIIKKVCEHIKQKNYKKYVEQKKTDVDIFEKYFVVIQAELCEKFIGKDGNSFSLYESLSNLFPDLTKEDYEKKHRNKIEYFLKQANKGVIKQLKEV